VALTLSIFAGRTERTIAASRVVLAAWSLFAIWLDPTEPARYVVQTYSLHALYVIYSIILAAVMWNRSTTGRLPLATHIADVVLFSMFQYLTLGPSSPFFVYFVFSLFCGALRWDWRGTLKASALVLTSYVAMGAWMSRTLGPTEFELNRFIIRVAYLAMVGLLLAYLGQHEMRLRAEIERLARWPSTANLDATDALQRLISHAAGLLGAGRALLVWETGDEPWRRVATWHEGALRVARIGPEEGAPAVPPALAGASFVCVDAIGDAARVRASGPEGLFHWQGAPIEASLHARLEGSGLASAPFRTDRVEGRIFFSDLGQPATETLSLTEVVAREVASSLDQMQSSEQMKEIAAREQRMRLARDLHDGVLQSLTGIRYEMQMLATQIASEPYDTTRDRLLAMERALAIEQRELRLFIDELRPDRGPGIGLRGRLEALRERVALEWKLPVTIRAAPAVLSLPAPIEEAVVLMAHEAIVNAMKHAQPTRVTVEIGTDEGVLHLVVSNDGRGFPFLGCYDADTVAAMGLGSTSLRERAASLGGRMSIESTLAGSRVDIAVPLGAV
jgi:signal transduction histidine kinase